MLQVENLTRCPATLTVFPSPAGVECAYAHVKMSFDLSSGWPELSAQQAGFLATDVYWGDPVTSSLRAAADLTLLKPTTDVLLAGRAIAADGPVECMEVGLSVGPVNSRLLILGNRVWEREGPGWRPSRPERFDRMPLRWELAFGGQASGDHTHAPEGEPRNPVGKGFVGSWETELANRSLPNIEDPAALIRRPEDRPEPAGFAPVAPSWHNRARHAGSYDAAWQKQRAPYLPVDFNPLFFQVAPPALIAPRRLVGGEPVELLGVTGGGILSFALPKPDLGLAFDFAGDHIVAEPQLDTILIEPDMARLQMVWRAVLELDKHLLKLTRLCCYDSRRPPE